jgi:hypothetical protein
MIELKFLEGIVAFNTRTAQQSVHPTLGILARFQAFFYASAFFQSDGVPPPAPARVTQTVGRLTFKNTPSFQQPQKGLHLSKRR